MLVGWQDPRFSQQNIPQSTSLPPHTPIHPCDVKKNKPKQIHYTRPPTSVAPGFGCPSVGLDHRGQPSLPTCINEHPMIFSPDNHHFFLATLLTNTNHSPSIHHPQELQQSSHHNSTLVKLTQIFTLAFLFNTLCINFKDKIVICCSIYGRCHYEGIIRVEACHYNMMLPMFFKKTKKNPDLKCFTILANATI